MSTAATTADRPAQPDPTPDRSPASRPAANQSPANQSPANQSPANQSPANRTPANRTPAARRPAKRSAAHRSPAKRRAARRSAANQSAAKPRIPVRIARLLSLLRWIVEYGQNCAAILLQDPTGLACAEFTETYRTADLAAILARIQRGLLIAAGLRKYLLHRAATRRRVRIIEVRLREPPQFERGPRQTPARRHVNLIALPLHLMPTEEQIAAELRRRPIGAVLVDICRDLGIRGPGDLTSKQWLALKDAVLCYGGSFVNLLMREWGAPPQLLTEPVRQPRPTVADPGPHILARPRPTGPPG